MSFGLVLLGGSLALYLLGLWVYRLAFHPLAKYPGPFIAKITSLYDAYHSWKGDRGLDQHRCHLKYGPYVRYGPNHLEVNTVDGLREIYSKSKNTQKSQQYTLFHEGGGISTNAAIDKQVHSYKKRVLSQAFSDTAMKSVEQYVVHNVDLWLKKLGSDVQNDGWTLPKNMAIFANHLTFDVLGDLCFGKSFNMLASPDLHSIPALVLARLKVFHVIGNSPLVPYWKVIRDRLHLAWLFLGDVAKKNRLMIEFSKQAVEERFERDKNETANDNESSRKDFIYWLSLARDPVTGEGFSHAELWGESRLLIGAGSDTTSITIAAAFFYLAQNPTTTQKLQEELRDKFGNVNDICSGPQLNSCHYLRAVIDETLRITPPIPSSLNREVTDDGITIDEHYIPAGNIVAAGTYSLHHNENYFRDPETFRPERWIVNPANGVSEDEVATARSAFCPFSVGSRACIGRPMAYMEASIALGRAFYQFDIRLKEGDTTGNVLDGKYGIKEYFVWTRDGPYIEFRQHSP